VASAHWQASPSASESSSRLRKLPRLVCAHRDVRVAVAVHVADTRDVESESAPVPERAAEARVVDSRRVDHQIALDGGSA
jgi:hypothetical protein